MLFMTISANVLDTNIWETWTPNGGIVEQRPITRLTLETASRLRYSNAQLDDYGPGRDLAWQPPLTLTVTARFNQATGPAGGTAGFGFWNDPGGARTRRMRPPRALWFFHAAPPNDLALDSVAPGRGWFAMTMDSLRWSLLPLITVAPFALPLMWLPPLRQRLWPLAQTALRTRIAPVRGPRDQWRTYQIEWLPQRVRFLVDGVAILDTPFSPHGPLGLVLWLDNQWAVVRPTGYLRAGLVDINQKTTLELQSLTIQQ